MIKKVIRDPTLDDIAAKLAASEKIGKTEQIMPSIMHSFLDFIKYKDEKGVSWYNFSIDDKQKDALAQKVEESLISHYYGRFGSYTKEEIADRRRSRNPLNESEADIMLTHYFKFGINSFKSQLKKIVSFSYNSFMQIAEGLKNNFHKYVENKLVEPVITSFKLDQVKDWIIDKINKFHLDPNLLATAEKITTMDEALNLYIPIAKNHYHGYKTIMA